MRINTKFNIGDKVFYLADNKVQFREIYGIRVSISDRTGKRVRNVLYEFYNLPDRIEKVLFNTKEELLNSL